MKLNADYHTHTTFSHGKGTIMDNVEQAARMNLAEIGIADHGFNHLLYGMKREELVKMRFDASLAEYKTGVRVLVGTEANLISMDGDIDARGDDNLNFIICGYHRIVKIKKGHKWKLVYSNILREFFMGRRRYHRANINKKWVQQNTDVLISALKKNRIDILSHPNRHFRVDMVRLAQACVKYNTAFELNAKSPLYNKKELEAVVKTGVKFVISSDAHKPKNVGNVEKVLTFIQGIVPEDQILNINGKKLTRKGI